MLFTESKRNPSATWPLPGAATVDSLPGAPTPSYPRTRAHSHVHTCTHTHSHEHTCTPSHVHTCVHSLVQRAHAHAHVHTCTHSHLHTRTHAQIPHVRLLPCILRNEPGQTSRAAACLPSPRHAHAALSAPLPAALSAQPGGRGRPALRGCPGRGPPVLRPRLHPGFGPLRGCCAFPRIAPAALTPRPSSPVTLFDAARVRAPRPAFSCSPPASSLASERKKGRSDLKVHTCARTRRIFSAV